MLAHSNTQYLMMCDKTIKWCTPKSVWGQYIRDVIYHKTIPKAIETNVYGGKYDSI